MIKRLPGRRTRINVDSMNDDVNDDVITMAHGSGGASSAELMRRVFSKYFTGEVLGRLEDSAVVGLSAGRANADTETDAEADLAITGKDLLIGKADHAIKGTELLIGGDRLAISTDSFVVEPLVFPGGDIGKLAVCGTVNDVLMSGANPRWLTCGFILETGLPIELLDRICASLAASAEEAGVEIIAGDTKVIEGRADSSVDSRGLMINTTGIGIFEHRRDGSFCVQDRTQKEPSLLCFPSPSGVQSDDVIIVSGNLGEHHAAILSARMGVENNIQSDCALLTPITTALREAGVGIHAMRDVTRGGLATVLNELADASEVAIEIEEESIPVSKEVKAFCGIMGLDPLYMGNEGKVALAVAPGDAEKALAAIRGTKIGGEAAVIGKAFSAAGKSFCVHPSAIAAMRDAATGVFMKTRVGGTVRLDALYGEGLPRIC